MSRIFSNGPGKDCVDEPFAEMLKKSNRANLAAPYFTDAKMLVDAAQKGTEIKLLVGLNLSTSPNALRCVHNRDGIEIRHCENFHAKIYIFDNAALLGSANLTNNGLRANREAVIRLDREIDEKAIEETSALFDDLWSRGTCLTESQLVAFERERKNLLERRQKAGLSDSEKIISDAIKQSERTSINPKQTPIARAKLDKFFDDYLFAFNKVKEIIEVPRFRNPAMNGIHIVYETNRFLNYLRMSKITDGKVRDIHSPSLSPEARQENIIHYGHIWAKAEDIHLPEGYYESIETIKRIFSTSNSIQDASKSDIVGGLLHLHSFRVTRRSLGKNPEEKFIKINQNDLDYVKERLTHLLHGPDDFIARIHEVSKEKYPKGLTCFGPSSAFELYGTVFPDRCPPINNRTVQILQFLDFDVKTLSL